MVLKVFSKTGLLASRAHKQLFEHIRTYVLSQKLPFSNSNVLSTLLPKHAVYNFEQEKAGCQAFVESLYQDKNLPAVLYQSDNFIAVNKGPYIKMNSEDDSEITLAKQLHRLFPDLFNSSVNFGFWFQHRLDFPTSGVTCVALNKIASRHLEAIFRNRGVSKYYLALVHGHVSFDRLCIDVPLGRDVSSDWVGKQCTADNPFCHRPRSASTLAVCMAKGYLDDRRVSKLLLKPFTGRTHQLRLHCQYVGHTIVGDYTYSDRQDVSQARMMLHAHRLAACVLEENLDITAPDPFPHSQSVFLSTLGPCSHGDNQNSASLNGSRHSGNQQSSAPVPDMQDNTRHSHWQPDKIYHTNQSAMSCADSISLSDRTLDIITYTKTS